MDRDLFPLGCRSLVIYLGKTAAGPESVLVDGGDAGGDGDHPQVRALVEGIGADGLKALGKDYGRQVIAVLESVLADGADG